MKSRLIYTVIFLITLLFITPGVVKAQSLVEHDITISGTSTLHDWESEVKQVNGNASIKLNGNSIEAINALELNMKVNSIESGKDRMNKNTYDALKEDKFPNIKFKLKNFSGLENNQVKATGDLEIAGVTKPVALTAKATVNGEKVTLKGSYQLKMTDFNVEPPELMLGTLKTGNEVTINYTIVYQL